MRYILSILFTCTLSLLLLSACQSGQAEGNESGDADSPPAATEPAQELDEERLKEDLQDTYVTTAYVDEFDYTFDITSVSIDRRKVEEKAETIHCTCDMTNGIYNLRGTYICYYNFYDEGGWFLEGVEPLATPSSSSSRLFPISENLADYTSIEQYLQSYLADFDVAEVESLRVVSDSVAVDCYVLKEEPFLKQEGTVHFLCGLGTSMTNSFSWSFVDDWNDVQDSWELVGEYYVPGAANPNQFAMTIDSFDAENQIAHVSYFQDEGFRDGASLSDALYGTATTETVLTDLTLPLSPCTDRNGTPGLEGDLEGVDYHFEFYPTCAAHSSAIQIAKRG